MIENAIYQLLSNDAQLSALLSASSVFHTEKPTDKNPEHYVIHYPLYESRPKDLALASLPRETDYRVQCYSQNFERSRQMFDGVEKLLNAYKGDVAGVRIGRITLNGSTPGSEPQANNAVPLYSITATFKINYTNVE